jgi:hypothetical protein
MKRHLIWAIALAAVACGARTASADSWIFHPSTYTHNPATGQRTTQFAQGVTPYVDVDPTFLRSGYRHNETTLRAGNSADHVHVVETWGMGDSIRPYGEWERPFRAGATPYGPWGNPQGPWTLPFDSWQNPYGLGQMPYNSGYRQPYGQYPQNAYPRPYGQSPQNSNQPPYGHPRQPPQPQPPKGP